MSSFIDISNLDVKNFDFIKEIIPDYKDPVLLYMPNISYQTKDFDELIAELGIRSYCIPVTLPVMDVVSQMKYVGIRVTPEIVTNIQNGIRKVIVDTLEEEGTNAKC